MARWLNVGGAWHQGGHAWVNVNGAWNAIGNMWININGVWHALYSYYWHVGEWGGCSVTCGGGVQYRDVICLRHDGWNGGWEGYCNVYVGAKPATSQACNTQSCANCVFSHSPRRYVGHAVSYPLAAGGCIGTPTRDVWVCLDDTIGLNQSFPCGAYFAGDLVDSNCMDTLREWRYSARHWLCLPA